MSKKIIDLILLALSAAIMITKAVIDNDNALETGATINEALNEKNDD